MFRAPFLLLKGNLIVLFASFSHQIETVRPGSVGGNLNVIGL